MHLRTPFLPSCPWSSPPPLTIFRSVSLINNWLFSLLLLRSLHHSSVLYVWMLAVVPVVLHFVLLWLIDYCFPVSSGHCVSVMSHVISLIILLFFVHCSFLSSILPSTPSLKVETMHWRWLHTMCVILLPLPFKLLAIVWFLFPLLKSENRHNFDPAS